MPQSSSHAVPDRPVEVLVVDDEAETRELLSECCRRNGLGVTNAPDGRAAIAAVERDPSRFEIVITDLHLPGADGFEVLRAARAANASAYVVIITGYATIDAAIRAVREGAYDFLAKPFALGQLEIVLRRIQDRMALERENRALLSRQAHTPHDVAHTRDLGWRLEAIEDRLARIEALLTKG